MSKKRPSQREFGAEYAVNVSQLFVERRNCAQPVARLILFPPIAIVCLAIAWVVAGPLSGDSTIVLTVYVGVLFGGFASVLFLAGWALHWYFRQRDHRRPEVRSTPGSRPGTNGASQDSNHGETL